MPTEWSRANPERAIEHQRKWRAKNRKHILIYKRKWRKKNKLKIRCDKYGISVQKYRELLEGQSFKCASCKVDLNLLPSSEIHIDHCHKSKIIRAILCGPCNRSLGLMQDDPNKIRKLAKYIESFNSK